MPTHPGLFPRVWNEDGTVNSTDNPARAGSIVVLYATGQGVTSPASVTGVIAVNTYPEPAASVTVRIGGREAVVLFRGQAPGTAGVMQINARVPEGVPSMAPVVVSVGTSESQAGVSVAVQ
jgi:uncharacterized protein (TIGR03437 family)